MIPNPREPSNLHELNELPAKMIRSKTTNLIRDMELAPSRRYWAIVGNGLNMVAEGNTNKTFVSFVINQ